MNDATLSSHLVARLRSQGAHADFGAVVRDWPPELRGVRPEGLPYSGWELVEHVRLAQRDILDFCRDPDYVQPDWPADYWPEDAAPPDEAAWDASLRAVEADRAALEALVADPEADLLAPVPNGDATQTLAREALLAADHMAYHLGQLVVVRRLLGAWPPEDDAG
jgi:uncharacterized damage-inducible protein DinB